AVLSSTKADSLLSAQRPTALGRQRAQDRRRRLPPTAAANTPAPHPSNSPDNALPPSQGRRAPPPVAVTPAPRRLRPSAWPPGAAPRPRLQPPGQSLSNACDLRYGFPAQCGAPSTCDLRHPPAPLPAPPPRGAAAPAGTLPPVATAACCAAACAAPPPLATSA
ncbi:hypothetical protein U9M48_002647, partial [Paspalum notatum var. saurae]